MAQNRYSQVVSNLADAAHHLCFVSASECLIIQAQKKLMLVYSLAGKCLHSVQVNLHHQLEVKSASSCQRKCIFVTQSPDTVNVWTLRKNGLQKLRTFNANGIHYLAGKMAQCGEYLLTLQKDGTTGYHSVDNQSVSHRIEFKKAPELVDANDVVVLGYSRPFL